MEQAVPVEGVDLCWVFIKHGRCRRGHDGRVGEWRKGVLVRVLVRVLVLVLVLMLVLVELGAQVWWWAQ